MPECGRDPVVSFRAVGARTGPSVASSAPPIVGWTMIDREREPPSGELVMCRLRCFLCRTLHEIGLPGNESIHQALARTSCPKCERRGAMRLAPPFPPPAPMRIEKYEEPPDIEGDEYLLARRVRRTE
jgi:hypothetical protein